MLFACEAAIDVASFIGGNFPYSTTLRRLSLLINSVWTRNKGAAFHLTLDRQRATVLARVRAGLEYSARAVNFNHLTAAEGARRSAHGMAHCRERGQGVVSNA